jgi:hypothetical protein
MHLRRHLAVPGLVLLLALAGCGGDDGGGEIASTTPKAEQNGRAMYEKAVRELDALKSGQLDARLETVLRLGGDKRLFVSEKATFADGGGTTLPKFDLDIEVEQPDAPTQQTSAINTGEDFLAKQQGQTEYQSQGAQAVKQLESTYAEEQKALGEGRIPLLALTPGDWATAPTVKGTGDFEGEPVRRLESELNVPQFLKDLETGKNSSIGMGVTLTQNARELLEPGAKTKTADLIAFIGQEDGRLRRLIARVDGEAGGGVKVDFDLRMSGLDEEQTIQAP